jgi:hypothetical protein
MIDGLEAFECPQMWDKLDIPWVIVMEAGRDELELDVDEKMDMFVDL